MKYTNKVKPNRSSKSIGIKSSIKNKFKGGSNFLFGDFTDKLDSSINNLNANFNKYHNDFLKYALLELTALNHQTKLLTELKNQGNKNAESLDKTLQNFLSGKSLPHENNAQISNQLSTLIQDGKAQNTDMHKLLTSNNFNILKLLDNSNSEDMHTKQMLTSLNTLNKKIDNEGITERKILDAIKTLSENGSINKQSTASGGGLLGTILSSAGGLLGSVLGGTGTALGIGGGALGIGALLSKFIKTKKGTNFEMSNSAVKGGVNRVPSVYKYAEEAGGLGKEAKFGSKFMKFGGKALKGVGKIFKPLGLLLTLGEVAGNVNDEFFGKDSDKKTFQEKLRNTVSKSLTGVLDMVTFGLSDKILGNDNITSGLKKFGDVIGQVSSDLYEVMKPGLEAVGKKFSQIANQIYTVVQPIFKGISDWGSSFIDTLLKKGTKAAIEEYITGPITQAADNFQEKHPYLYAAGKTTYDVLKFANPLNPAINAFKTLTGTGGGDSTGNNQTGNGGDNDKFSYDSSVQNSVGQKLVDYMNKHAGSSSGGKCYNSVYNGLKEVIPNLPKGSWGGNKTVINGFGKKEDVNLDMDAAGFKYWVDQYGGNKYFSDVTNTIDPKSKNLNLLPGDVIVYDKGIFSSEEHGHIEVLDTKNNNGISDFITKDRKNRLLSPLVGKGIFVYRMKQMSKINPKTLDTNAQANNTTNTNNKSSNASKSANFDASNMKATSVADAAFAGITMNETSNRSDKIYKASDQGNSLTIGRSQFNSKYNPDAWVKLGNKLGTKFGLSDLNTKTASNLNYDIVKNTLAKMDKTKVQKAIDEMDNDQKNMLSNKADQLFKDAGIIADPKAKAQLMDTLNYQGINSVTAAQLKAQSVNGKIDANGVISLRSKIAKDVPSAELTKRSDNINAAMDAFLNKTANTKLASNTPNASNNTAPIAKQKVQDMTTDETALPTGLKFDYNNLLANNNLIDEKSKVVNSNPAIDKVPDSATRFYTDIHNPDTFHIQLVR